MKQPVKVAITGAAGQISYSLLFRIASGDMLGKDQPVILQLLEVEQAMTALKGVMMELEDCAFPLVHGITATSDAMVAFNDVSYALLVGSKPRSKGMERKDLLEVNGAIFTTQGKALGAVAKKDVKVIIVGNPANTNAVITLKNASGLSSKNITSMMRLDHNRAISQLATKTNKHNTTVEHVVVWGNHSSTQYPDVSYATVDGVAANKLVDNDWLNSYFVPTVQKRGAAIIEARGLSSAASAASAALDHMRDWIFGTPAGKWVTMGILSDGSYGVPEGLMFGFPVTCKDGEFHMVKDLEISAESKTGMALTIKELQEELDGVKHLL